MLGTSSTSPSASREAGFTEHLLKPVDLAALQAAIERVARKQHA